jgi:hypothetical protein
VFLGPRKTEIWICNVLRNEEILQWREFEIKMKEDYDLLDISLINSVAQSGFESNLISMK